MAHLGHELRKKLDGFTPQNALSGETLGRVLQVKLGEHQQSAFSHFSAENDPFLARHPPNPPVPGETEDYLKGYLAGFAGLPGEFIGGQAKPRRLEPTSPAFNRASGPSEASEDGFFPTINQVGEFFNADVESDAFKTGTIGIPGIDDVLLKGTALAGKGLLAMTLFHGTPTVGSANSPNSPCGLDGSSPMACRIGSPLITGKG